MIRTVARGVRRADFSGGRSLIILIAEVITIFVAWLLLDRNTKGWLHAKAAQAIQISQWAASASDWSRIDKVPKEEESTLGDSYQNRLADLSDKLFCRNAGSVYLAFLEHGEEYDMYSRIRHSDSGCGKGDRWVLNAYVTQRMTYTCRSRLLTRWAHT